MQPCSYVQYCGDQGGEQNKNVQSDPEGEYISLHILG